MRIEDDAIRFMSVSNASFVNQNLEGSGSTRRGNSMFLTMGTSPVDGAVCESRRLG
jgi:hypothetical protein